MFNASDSKAVLSRVCPQCRFLYPKGLLSCLNNLERTIVEISMWPTLCAHLSCSKQWQTSQCLSAYVIQESICTKPGLPELVELQEWGFCWKREDGLHVQPSWSVDATSHFLLSVCLLMPWWLCGVSFPMCPGHKGALQEQGLSPYLHWRTLSGWQVVCIVLEDRIDINLLQIQALQKKRRD